MTRRRSSAPALVALLALAMSLSTACFEQSVPPRPPPSAWGGTGPNPPPPTLPPPPPAPGQAIDAWTALGGHLTRGMDGAHLNRYGQVIDVQYLAWTLRQNGYRSVAPGYKPSWFSSALKPGDAAHLDHVIYDAAPTDASHHFHESIHAIEEVNGDTGKAGDFAERNAYWMERHFTLWVPWLWRIEGWARDGRLDLARSEFLKLRGDYVRGVPESNATFPRPDGGGLSILRRAGFRFDIDAAGAEVERLAGVRFIHVAPSVQPQPPATGVHELFAIDNASGALFFGTEDDLRRRLRCSFEGGGVGCGPTDLVKYRRLVGPLPEAQARDAACKGFVKRHFYPIGIGWRALWRADNGNYGVWDGSVDFLRECVPVGGA